MVDEALRIRISAPPDAARWDYDRLLSPIPAHLCMGRFARQGARIERPCRCREYRQGLSLRARLRDMGETAYGLCIVPAQMLELAIEGAIIAPSFLRVVRKWRSRFKPFISSIDELI